MAKSKSSTQKPLFENLTSGLDFTKSEPKPKVEEKLAKPEPTKSVQESKPEPIPEQKKETIMTEKETIRKKNQALSFSVKKAEKREVRKQFLLTPSQEKWLSETAKQNGVSENEVINTLITSAMS